MEVWGLSAFVLDVVVLLCDEDTILEQGLVDLGTVCLGNKPRRSSHRQYEEALN